MKIIVVGGQGNSGKTTFSTLLIENTHYRYIARDNYYNQQTDEIEWDRFYTDIVNAIQTNQNIIIESIFDNKYSRTKLFKLFAQATNIETIDFYYLNPNLDIRFQYAMKRLNVTSIENIEPIFNIASIVTYYFHQVLPNENEFQEYGLNIALHLIK